MAEEEVTLAQAAAARGISRRTLAYAASKGHLDARRFGHLWATTLMAVDRWLATADERVGPNPGEGPKRQRSTASTADQGTSSGEGAAPATIGEETE